MHSAGWSLCRNDAQVPNVCRPLHSSAQPERYGSELACDVPLGSHGGWHRLPMLRTATILRLNRIAVRFLPTS